MDETTYERLWRLFQVEIARRGTLLPVENYQPTPEGVKTISDNTLLWMVVVGLLKRVQDLERGGSI